MKKHRESREHAESDARKSTQSERASEARDWHRERLHHHDRPSEARDWHRQQHPRGQWLEKGVATGMIGMTVISGMLAGRASLERADQPEDRERALASLERHNATREALEAYAEGKRQAEERELDLETAQVTRTEKDSTPSDWNTRR